MDKDDEEEIAKAADALLSGDSFVTGIDADSGGGLSGTRNDVEGKEDGHGEVERKAEATMETLSAVAVADDGASS